MCVHHYRLPSPDGPLVTGTCKHCGASREFKASSDPMDDARWSLTPRGRVTAQPRNVRATYGTYPCPDCGKAVKTKGGLKSHRKQTHGVAA